jgi:hypothetical protein
LLASRTSLPVTASGYQKTDNRRQKTDNRFKPPRSMHYAPCPMRTFRGVGPTASGSEREPTARRGRRLPDAHNYLPQFLTFSASHLPIFLVCPATRNRIRIPEDRCQRTAVRGQNERIRSDRRYVYEAASLKQPAQGRVKVIENTVLEKERSKEFELSKNDRFKISCHNFDIVLIF